MKSIDTPPRASRTTATGDEPNGGQAVDPLSSAELETLINSASALVWVKVSGYSEDFAGRPDTGEGAELLEKPFDDRKLLRGVRGALGGAAPS